jgi:hypothetical protein
MLCRQRYTHQHQVEESIDDIIEYRRWCPSEGLRESMVLLNASTSSGSTKSQDAHDEGVLLIIDSNRTLYYLVDMLLVFAVI